ncbi:MAG: hypothetical protein M1377_06610 [Deltaproteobacteria bacterium]|nr:hypothetical protein [Deltaproteobacteria bacterium]MDA8178538.1 hypothetical protein [Deltaproteobacteria bacterium]
MPEYKILPIANLQLDTSNYRIRKQDSQEAARMAIIEEQGKKLVVLAEDIINFGLSPFDLPMVAPVDGTAGMYFFIEGNRRFTAIRLTQEPELAKGTELYPAFQKLNGKYASSLPTEIFCVEVPDKNTGLIWIQRKHDKGLQGAGTEPWSSIAKDRADADLGKPAPIVDALDFVANNASLDPETIRKIAGPRFPITNLSRILGTKYVRESLGINSVEGKLSSTSSSKWILNVLTDIVTAIATGQYQGEPFSEKNIDSVEQRQQFIDGLLKKRPRPTRKEKEWVISGGYKILADSTRKPSVPPGPKLTPTTDERDFVIPKKFKMALSDGKINNIFIELKKLDAKKFKNAASVLLRVFLEFSVDHYINKNNVSLLKNKETLKDKLKKISEHMISNNVMAYKELKSVRVAISNKDSLISPETLNAYVHNSSFNPDPDQLKRTWDDFKLFIEKIWA